MRLAFPWYNNILLQSRFKNVCKPESLFGILSPNDRLLPTILERDPTGTGKLECLTIYKIDKPLETVSTIFAYVNVNNFTHKFFTYNSKEYIVYYGAIIAGLNMPCGYYYAEIDGYFSEVFKVADIENYTMIEYSNPKNIGGILYQTGFAQRIFLDASILDDDPEVDEESKDDGQGTATLTFQKILYRHKIDTDLLPQYLLHAINLIPLHENVLIGNYQNVRDIKIERDEVTACYSNLSISFAESEIITSRICEPDLLLIETAVQLNYNPAACEPGGVNKLPNWVNQNSFRCQGSNNATGQAAHASNTGKVERQQLDTNVNSYTYNQTRWVETITDLAACPIVLTATVTEFSVNPTTISEDENDVQFKIVISRAIAADVTFVLTQGHSVTITAGQTQGFSEVVYLEQVGTFALLYNNNANVTNPNGLTATVAMQQQGTPGKLWLINSSSVPVVIASNNGQISKVYPVSDNPVIVQNESNQDLLLTQIYVLDENSDNFTEESEISVSVHNASFYGQPSSVLKQADGATTSVISQGVAPYESTVLEENSLYGITAARYSIGDSFVIVISDMEIAPIQYTMEVKVNGNNPGPGNLLSKGQTIAVKVKRVSETGALCQFQVQLKENGLPENSLNADGGLIRVFNFDNDQAEISWNFTGVNWHGALNNPAITISMTIANNPTDADIDMISSSAGIFVVLAD